MMIFEYLKPAALIGSFVYSLLGILFVMVTFVVIDKLTPGNLWKELIEERNQAIATVVAAMILAIAIIVASAMHLPGSPARGADGCFPPAASIRTASSGCPSRRTPARSAARCSRRCSSSPRAGSSTS